MITNDIQTAILRNDMDMFRSILLDVSTDLTRADKFGSTPLHMAVKQGSIEMVRSILEYPVNVNDQGALDDFSPLHYAAQKGFVEIVEMLIDKGADIHSRDNDGNTPLFVAVMQYRSKMSGAAIASLLKHGANPATENDHGVSVYNILSMPKNESIRDLFPPQEP